VILWCRYSDIHRSGTNYRNALLFGVSACIEAEPEFAKLKHVCIYYNDKPSSTYAGSDGTQKHQSSEHQPLPVTCTAVVEDSRQNMLNRAPFICSLCGKEQNLWPAGTLPVMSAVVDLDPDS